MGSTKNAIRIELSVPTLVPSGPPMDTNCASCRAQNQTDGGPGSPTWHRWRYKSQSYPSPLAHAACPFQRNPLARDPRLDVATEHLLKIRPRNRSSVCIRILSTGGLKASRCHSLQVKGLARWTCPHRATMEHQSTTVCPDPRTAPASGASLPIEHKVTHLGSGLGAWRTGLPKATDEFSALILGLWSLVGQGQFKQISF